MQRFPSWPLLAAAIVAAVPAGAQERGHAVPGERVGVRNESPDAPGISLDGRASRRLPTRIETRVNSRITRRDDHGQALWAYRMPQDDGSRDTATVITTPPGAGTVR